MEVDPVEGRVVCFQRPRICRSSNGICRVIFLDTVGVFKKVTYTYVQWKEM